MTQSATGGSTPGITTVVTIVHGRHRHLQRQMRSLEALATEDAVHHVVVAMGDSAIPELAAGESRTRPTGARRTVTELAVGPDGELPLAAARNLGAEVALDLGADLLVFLDVDCLAHPDLVTDYRAAALSRDGALPDGRASAASRDPLHLADPESTSPDGRASAASRDPLHLADPESTSPDGRASAASRDPQHLTGPVLWCGQVSYLPPLPAGVDDYPDTGLESWAAPHAARPVLPAGTTQLSKDVKLFWSLNFAVTAADWRSTGGFHPGYRGYGGEDTDFAHVVAARGGGIGWIGGAGAFHQYHPTSSPPWQHLTAIVRNAHLFHDRWGWFPMEGWLSAFAAEGAVDYRPDDGVLELIT